MATLGFAWLATEPLVQHNASLAPAALLSAAGALFVVSVRAERRAAIAVIERQADDLRAARATLAALTAKAAVARPAGNAASVTQDLDEPLAVVLASTRSLLEPDAGLSGRALELAESAARNAGRVARIVEDAALTADPDEPVRGIVDVAAVVREAAASRRAPVRIDCAGDPAAIGDPRRLRSAIERLVADAAATDAPPSVVVRAEGATIEISVAAEAPVRDRSGLLVARRLLAGTGAQLTLDLGGSRTVVVLPGIATSALEGRARWSATGAARPS